jgi:hypothetical protein
MERIFLTSSGTVSSTRRILPHKVICLLLFDKAYLHFKGTDTLVSLLKPSGYVMHQQFNIQKLYALPTLYLCVLYLSENKQRLVLLVGFYNRVEKCLQRGTDWVSK